MGDSRDLDSEGSDLAPGSSATLGDRPRRLTIDSVKRQLLIDVLAVGGKRVRVTKQNRRWFPGLFVSFEGKLVCIAIIGVNGSWWRRNLRRWLTEVNGKSYQALIYDAREEGIGVPVGLQTGPQALRLQQRLTEESDHLRPSEILRRLRGQYTGNKMAGRPGELQRADLADWNGQTWQKNGRAWRADLGHPSTKVRTTITALSKTLSLEDLLASSLVDRHPRSAHFKNPKPGSATPARFRDAAEETQLTGLARTWLAENLPNSDVRRISLFDEDGRLRPSLILAFRRLATELARQKWTMNQYCSLLRRRGEYTNLPPFEIRTRKLGCGYYTRIAYEQNHYSPQPGTGATDRVACRPDAQ
jgi:hypothetical protein